MRMGVVLGRLAMRSPPARMADTGETRQEFAAQTLLQILQLTAAPAFEMAVLNSGNAG